MAPTHEGTLLEPKLHDVIKTLVKQQIAVLAASSELSRKRKEVGDLKKERDGTIAEIARLEIDLSHIELPLGLTRDERGYVVAVDEDTDEEDEE